MTIARIERSGERLRVWFRCVLCSGEYRLASGQAFRSLCPTCAEKEGARAVLTEEEFAAIRQALLKVWG